jgi:hypothetical protein
VWCGFYALKIIWPANLMFNYPRWVVDASSWWQYLFLIALAGTLAALFAYRQRSRAPLAAALFFVGTLFPVLGLFNVYPFRFSFVADHFQYLACLGLIAGLAAGGHARGEPASLATARVGAGCGVCGAAWPDDVSVQPVFR